jgi:hypothetical protein
LHPIPRQVISAPVRFLLNVGDQTAAELIFTAVLLLVRRAGKNCRHARFPTIPLEISKPTIADAQKLVQTITGDKAKLQAYCEIGKLQEEMEKADQKNDTKALEALGTKADSLAQQIGPEYAKVMDGLEEVDPNSAEGKQYTAVFATLAKQCK